MRTWRRRILVSCVAAVGVWLLLQRIPWPCHTPVGFAGPSTKLQRTVVVPTLDTPMPPQRNVIWCASFLMAWRQAQTQVLHGPLQLAGVNPMAERLNRAPLPATLVDEKDRYINAGRIEDGIIDTIRRDMRQKFPDVPASWLPAPRAGEGIDAYAYLALHVKFAQPYPQQPGGARFVDSAQHETMVRAFGLSAEQEHTLYGLRKQVAILFRGVDDTSGVNEFAVDLCRTSTPYRIILACVPRRATLADTIAQVQRRLPAPNYTGELSPLGSPDELIVPEMCWRIAHHFPELEGQQIRNAGGALLVDARQVMDFRLDRSGARLASASSLLSFKSAPNRFSFTQPFLLYITRRGSNAPCFAMWVDNAELLNTVQE